MAYLYSAEASHGLIEWEYAVREGSARVHKEHEENGTKNTMDEFHKRILEDYKAESSLVVLPADCFMMRDFICPQDSAHPTPVIFPIPNIRFSVCYQLSESFLLL